MDLSRFIENKMYNIFGKIHFSYIFLILIILSPQKYSIIDLVCRLKEIEIRSLNHLPRKKKERKGETKLLEHQ